MKMTLIVNDIEVTLGVESMKSIAQCIDDKPEFQEIYHEMALSDISSIKEYIANKDHISKETAKLLLADKDDKVLENIISNEAVKTVMTDEDIEHIIKNASQNTIKDLIRYLDGYENVDMDRAYSKLLASNNADIVLTIAENYSTPKKLLRQLAKYPDSDIARAAKESLE